MAGTILLADEHSSSRILLRARLAQTHHQVIVADTLDEARRLARQWHPDVALIGFSEDEASLALLRELKSDPATAATELVAFVRKSGGTVTAEALAAGADDVLDRTMPEAVVMARLRSRMRARSSDDDLARRGDAEAALGFAELRARFETPAPQRPGTVALVTGDMSVAETLRAALEPHLRDRIVVLSRDALYQAEAAGLKPDVYVIAADLEARHDGLTLIAELRSRAEARTAGIVALVHPLDTAGAVSALDLGAGDVVELPVNPLELVERLRGQLRRKARADRLRQQISDGLKLAVTDPLTGLKNRRYALATLARVADEAEATGRPFAVMVLDLDHFKRVNDTHGHGAGDAVLAEAAQRISGALRAADTVARLGGEEFLVVMPDTTPEAAAAAGERLRRLVEAAPFHLPGSGGELSLTVSVGVAVTGSGHEAADRMVDLADKALYSAKADGRNLVSISRQTAA